MQFVQGRHSPADRSINHLRGPATSAGPTHNSVIACIIHKAPPHRMDPTERSIFSFVHLLCILRCLL
jgi:hypothetical protein